MARYRGIQSGVVRGIPHNPSGCRMRGHLHVYFDNKRGWIARSWPKGNGGDTPARAASRELFKAIVAGMSNPQIDEKRAALKVAEGTPFTWRDVMSSAAYGNLIFSIDVNGKYWMGWRLAFATIQVLLDSILNTPGCILGRSLEGWVALLPGDDGQVLTFDSGQNFPQWKTISVDVQSILDQLAPSAGDMAQFDGLVWNAVDPSALFDSAGSAAAAQAAAEAFASALVAGITVPTAANPSATATDTAVNGTSAHYMRADASPAVQKATTAAFGLVKPDGSTTDISGGLLIAKGFLATGAGFHPGFVTGRYYSQPCLGGSGTASTTANQIYSVPVYLPAAATIDKIAYKSGSIANAHVCLGIYADSSGQPGAKLYDSGNITPTTNTMISKSGLGLVLSAGWYWLAFATDTTANIFVSLNTSLSLISLYGVTDFATQFCMLTRAWTYSAGNLPDPFGTPTYSAAAAPLLGIST